jgi:hypothetical protein
MFRSLNKPKSANVKAEDSAADEDLAVENSRENFVI